MTFRVRTALVVVVLTALTMGGAFAAVWEQFVSSQRRQLDDALITVARREAAEAAVGAIEFTDAPGPTANAVGPLPKYGVLYGINGKQLAHTDNFATVPSMPHTMAFDMGFDFDHDGIPMRGVIVAVGNTGRRILLAAPRIDFEEDARILARAMAIAFGVGCVWVALVAVGIATRLTRQHRIVGDVARRVASGDTSARVSLQVADADLRQLADDLNAMIERLVGLLAVQERFIAHAAHELRTPLTSLRIEIEHAIRNARGREHYDLAYLGELDSARRLSELADDLLALARVKSGHAGMTTAIESALSDAVADVAPVGRRRNVYIINEPISATVAGDRRGVARLLRNVLENAVRFSPAGRNVWVATDLDGEFVSIIVTDQGPGIAEDDLEKIFEPFARVTRDLDIDDGAGLGLTIARGLARAFGGDLVATSGKGGRFVVKLPIVDAKRLSPPSPAAVTAPSLGSDPAC